MFTGEININQIYDQFSKQIAPKIAEWFTMTKDWFINLSGRYVEYSIMYEMIWIILSSIIVIVLSIVAVKVYKFFNKPEKDEGWSERSDRLATKWLLSLVASLVALVFFIVWVSSAFSLVKRKYVPEIQMYKELSNINSSWVDPISK